VEVAEEAAAHGGRFAVKCRGRATAASVELHHEAFSCLCPRYGHPPSLLPAPPGVSPEFLAFSDLRCRVLS